MTDSLQSSGASRKLQIWLYTALKFFLVYFDVCFLLEILYWFEMKVFSHVLSAYMYEYHVGASCPG